MKVVYLTSLARSGSTFLELLLSRTSSIVGLGELGHTLETLSEFDSYYEDDSDRDLQCACGRTADHCEFWGPLLDPLSRVPPEEGHRLILEAFKEEYPNHVLLDSTKDVKYLYRHYFTEEFQARHELKILYLIRDFRGWSLSYTRRQREKGRRMSYLRACYRWLRKNLKNRWLLRQAGHEPHHVSYENLVFETDQQVERLLNRLEVPFEELPSVKDNFESHSLIGNPMRLQPEKKEDIIYDPTWLRDWRHWSLLPLLLPVYAYNQWIYSTVFSTGYREMYSSD